MSFLPLKLAAIWKFRPSGAKKIHTVLQPSASGQYGFFCLLQVGISILLPPSVGGTLQTSLTSLNSLTSQTSQTSQHRYKKLFTVCERALQSEIF